jgi:prolyl-tRNA editing enzyme YbaK/EbsC (Cys-tRNA(Pro) deacylase)
MSDVHPTVARVVAAAEDAGLQVEVGEFPAGTKTAADAAAAVGSDVAAIIKSLVFRVVGGPDGDVVVLALVGGADRLDEAKLAAVVGGTGTERMDADAVREATGYAIGGIPPLGHVQPLPTWVDDRLLEQDEVWAAAGTPRHVFPVAPAALVAATGATVTVLRVDV